MSDITCPMPECDGVLIVTWSAAYTLSPEDITRGGRLLVDEAHTSSWDVRCVAGHVILLPDHGQCDCADPGGDTCPDEHDDLFDWDEESRTFRPHDWARLRGILARLAQPAGVPA